MPRYSVPSVALSVRRLKVLKAGPTRQHGRSLLRDKWTHGPRDIYTVTGAPEKKKKGKVLDVLVIEVTW